MKRVSRVIKKNILKKTPIVVSKANVIKYLSIYSLYNFKYQAQESPWLPSPVINSANNTFKTWAKPADIICLDVS